MVWPGCTILETPFCRPSKGKNEKILPQKAGKSPISGDGAATALVSGSSARWAGPQHVRWRCCSTLSAAKACEADDPARAGADGSRSSVWLVFSPLKAAASAFSSPHNDGQPSVRAASLTPMQSLSALRALQLAVGVPDERAPLQLNSLPLTREWALWHCKPSGPVLEVYRCRDRVSVAKSTIFYHVHVFLQCSTDRPTDRPPSLGPL